MNLGLKSEDLEQIAEVLARFDSINKAVVFGSRAKGQFKRGSDIDLAVVGDKIGFKELCKIGAMLDELDLPYEIDVISYDRIESQALKEHIDRVGVNFDIPKPNKQKA